MQALHKLGVEAELSGRNDIHVGTRKISGNAQFTTRGRMFSHGTLMLDSNIEEVVNALVVSEEKMRSKGIKSVRSRVANISEFLTEPLTMDQFVDHLLASIYEGKEIERYTLTEADWEKVNAISAERYGNWDWNFGKSPKFDVIHKKRFPIGTIDFRLNVTKGIIQEAKIYGDFFGVADASEIAQALEGKRYDRASLREVLSQYELKKYFGAVELDEVLDVLA